MKSLVRRRVKSQKPSMVPRNSGVWTRNARKRWLKLAQKLIVTRLNFVRQCWYRLRNASLERIVTQNIRSNHLWNWSLTTLVGVFKLLKIENQFLGERCVIFDAMGSCNFGVACRYASAHTNEDYTQKTKDPDPSYKPTLNAHTLDIQISIRKHTYDFTPADKVR